MEDRKWVILVASLDGDPFCQPGMFRDCITIGKVRSVSIDRVDG